MMKGAVEARALILEETDRLNKLMDHQVNRLDVLWRQLCRLHDTGPETPLGQTLATVVFHQADYQTAISQFKLRTKDYERNKPNHEDHSAGDGPGGSPGG